MFSKLLLYGHTVVKMKPSQILARVKRTLGLRISLGIKVSARDGEIVRFRSPRGLDFDPVFIARYNVDEFSEGKVTFLHETEKIDWKGRWEAPNRSPLWNFNLHYFEFLTAYVNAYKVTQDKKYIKAIEESIDGWIANNPISDGGNGWTAYTISLRIVYWFSCLFKLWDDFDEQFRERMINSLYAQYVYLANHLEKDILANHYFEDLKALILCSIVFNDHKMLKAALKEFKNQCRTQILSDGMHCELSPMYHKIMLEALLRTAVALRSVNKGDKEIESYIQPMVDAAYSIEEGLDRIPLFNDGGNNVAKSLEALLQTVRDEFHISPEYKAQFPVSGYYIFKQSTWKMIVDAGAPGPKYNSGHAHCDAMSFELFHSGKPVVVNCGTYAYQCKERPFFRSTSAHNTAMVEGVEQSECWSIFRMGKCCRIVDVKAGNKSIAIHILDKSRNILKRTIKIDDHRIQITDKSPGKKIVSFLHVIGTNPEIMEGQSKSERFLYSEEYGKTREIKGYKISGDNTISYSIQL